MYVNVIQKYMKSINIKEIGGFQKQGKRENKRKWVGEVTIFLVPKLISAFIDGSKNLIY